MTRFKVSTIACAVVLSQNILKLNFWANYLLTQFISVYTVKIVGSSAVHFKIIKVPLKASFYWFCVPKFEFPQPKSNCYMVTIMLHSLYAVNIIFYEFSISKYFCDGATVKVDVEIWVLLSFHRLIQGRGWWEVGKKSQIQ